MVREEVQDSEHGPQHTRFMPAMTTISWSPFDSTGTIAPTSLTGDTQQQPSSVPYLPDGKSPQAEQESEQR